MLRIQLPLNGSRIPEGQVAGERQVILQLFIYAINPEWNPEIAARETNPGCNVLIS